MSKTNELVVDLRRAKALVIPMHRVSVDIVEDCINLRVHIDNKMDGIKNIEALYKKNQSHLYFLRKRRSLNIWLRMLYELPVALLFVVSQ